MSTVCTYLLGWNRKKPIIITYALKEAIIFVKMNLIAIQIYPAQYALNVTLKELIQYTGDGQVCSLTWSHNCCMWLGVTNHIHPFTAVMPSKLQ